MKDSKHTPETLEAAKWALRAMENMPECGVIEVIQEFRENGKKFLLLKDNGKEWEEPIDGWTMVIDLNIGATVFNHPDGRVASYMSIFPEEQIA